MEKEVRDLKCVVKKMIDSAVRQDGLTTSWLEMLWDLKAKVVELKYSFTNESCKQAAL